MNSNRRGVGEDHARKASDEFSEHHFEFQLRQAGAQTKMSAPAEGSAGLSRAVDVDQLRVIESGWIVVGRSQETNIRCAHFGRPAAKFRALRCANLVTRVGAVERRHLCEA